MMGLMAPMNFILFKGGWILMIQLLSWQWQWKCSGVMKGTCAHDIEMVMGYDGAMRPVELNTTTGEAADDIGTVKDASALRRMMRIATETGNHGSAIKVLEQLIRLEPQNERNFFHRHISYLHERRYDDAIADLTSALKLRPRYKQALAQRAKVNRIAGYCENSVKDYMALEEIDPKHPDLKEGLPRAWSCREAFANADQLFNEKEFSSARELYDDILLHMEGNQDTILAQRAICSWNLNEWSDVVFDAGRLLKVVPNSIQGLTLRGFAYYNLGDIEMALNHFREALKFDPENKECKDAYHKFRKIDKIGMQGQEKLKANNFKLASELFQQAATLANNGRVASHYILEAARALCKTKEWKKCVKAAESAKEFDNDLLDAYLLLGEAYMSLEKYKEAAYAYTKASQIEPRNQDIARKLRNAEVALAQSKKIDYYKILEVGRNAETIEIKKSYKRLALLWHPDKHAGKSEEEREDIEDKFQKVAEAYEVLSTTELRRKYDNGEEVFENQGHRGGQNHHQQYHFRRQKRRHYYYHG